jgi:hypothetical protein
LIVTAIVSVGIATLMTGHSVIIAGFAVEKILAAALLLLYISILVQIVRLRH